MLTNRSELFFFLPQNSYCIDFVGEKKKYFILFDAIRFDNININLIERRCPLDANYSVVRWLMQAIVSVHVNENSEARKKKLLAIDGSVLLFLVTNSMKLHNIRQPKANK